jgi:HEAT repeat protein
MNRAKIALVGLVLVVGGSFFVREFSLTRDPVIRGQRLSRWLMVLSSDREDSPSYNAAVEAVREAGTNGLPLMISMLQIKDSSARQAAAWVLRSQNIVHAKLTMEWDVRLAALRGLKFLGPQAEMVAPRLGELMCVTNCTMEATLALLQMGRPALRYFRSALTNQEPMVKSWAAVGIRELHNEQAVGWGIKPGDAAWDKELVGPLLLLSTDSKVQNFARGALAAIIRTDPDTAVPEVSKGLEDPNKNVREEAARVLAVSIQFQPPTTR